MESNSSNATASSGANTGGKDEKNSEQNKDSSVKSDAADQLTSNQKEEPVKETDSSKEISNSQPNVEKRPRESLDDDVSEENQKKKSKKDDSPVNTSASAGIAAATTSSTCTTLAGNSNVVTATTKISRGTRGSLSERIDKGGKATKRTGGEKRMSPTSSATNSPKKPASRDHSDEEVSDEAAKKSTEPKVPPLKIVLSGSSGNNAGSSEEKKSPTGLKDQETKELDKSNIKETTEATDMGSTNPSSVANSDGFDDDSSKGGNSNHSNSNTRLTRSRANQGTPGPGDQANDSPRDSSLNHLALDDRANLEPPSKEPPATVSTSMLTNNPNSMSSSNNINYADLHYVKKRKLRSQVDDQAPSTSTNAAASASNSNLNDKNGQNKTSTSATNEPLNDIEKYLSIRKQVEQRRKNLFPVFLSKPPQGFKDYLMNRKTYLLQGNERCRSIPMIQPPHSLGGALKELFVQQEKERYKLRLKHVVEKEKLVLAVEQEILRVHGRAARALANQSLPYSVCTILRDEEIYTPIDPQQEEKNRDIRSRYNGRLFLSWLQDVDDKWEKIKEQMVLRHHNEAESLNAVQKMDWEWKVNEITGGTGDGVPTQMDDLHIPMINVSDDFDLANG